VGKACGGSTPRKRGKNSQEEEWVECPGYEADTGKTRIVVLIMNVFRPERPMTVMNWLSKETNIKKLPDSRFPPSPLCSKYCFSLLSGKTHMDLPLQKIYL
jgi:hypothetical protein